MATSLLLAFPTIPRAALGFTVSETVADLNAKYNLVSGPRYHQCALGGTATAVTYTWDLGTGNAASADHVIIGRADLLETGTSSTTDIDVEYSDNNSIWTSWHADSSFDTATLQGPEAKDYIHETFGSSSTAHRYWRVTLTADVAQKFRHSKIYLGEFFNIGVDPSDYAISVKNQTERFISADGTSHYERNLRPLYELDFTWRGVSDTNADTLIHRLQDPRYAGVFLYADTETKVLDGHSLIHCECIDCDIEPIYNDWNSVRARFREYV